MIKRISCSEKDKQNISNCSNSLNCQQDQNFSGVVVNKPWGYEYLMFQNENMSIWMLYIKNGFSTSVHCHPNKKTSLLIISGEAISSTLEESFNLNEKDGLIFDRGVFHTTEAVSENGVFLMEVETPSDKTDLFRLHDKYNRAAKKYTNIKNVTSKIYNYHYLNIKNELNGDYIFGKYKFFIREYHKKDALLNDIKNIGADIGIILSGEAEINNEKLSCGDLLDINLIESADIIQPLRVLLLHERKNLVKLSDFVISFLQKNGINNVFLVSGGNLMHLLESVRTLKMNFLCNHHEQASAMAAESFSKLTGRIGFAMVTSGPGATNAITGVAGAWIDSNPLIVISGQSYDSQTIGNTGLRQLGVQEINIVDMVKPITKYAVMVKDPKKIKYHLEEALYLANSGRPGPVWLDIPINIQMAMIQENELESFSPIKKEENKDNSSEISNVFELIKASKRPLILLGNGVRLAHAEKEFLELAEKLSIPIVTSRNANDLIWDNHPLYAGRPGSFGQRPANFAIQNCDLLISIGSRISLALTGWAYRDFARGAKIIAVDIDSSELDKKTIFPYMKINSDAKKFILDVLSKIGSSFSLDIQDWKEKIKMWKSKYPIVLPEYKKIEDSVNPYYFTDILSNVLGDRDIVITDMGMSFQCVMQSFKVKKGQRIFTSAGLAAMGFGLPGAIGACIGNDNKRVICISGDGGLQMNIQELQVLKHYNLPVKLFVFNNKGYSSIRETQKTYFKGFLGSDASSGVSIPDTTKVAEAYGIKTKKIIDSKNLEKEIIEILESEGPVVCDINISETCPVMPRQGAFNRPDGKTVPRPIEDLLPYMDRDELYGEMIIEPIPFDPYKGEL